MNKLAFQKLNCLSGSVDSRHYSDTNILHYNSAYRLWRSVFIDGLKGQKLYDKANNFKSDEFLRQDTFLALYQETFAVGIIMLKQLDLRCDPTLEHTYFNNYTSEFTHFIQTKYRKVTAVSNLMIHADWRKSAIGPGMSDILMGLALKEFLCSDTELAITYTRNDRKTDALCYRYGGIIKSENGILYNSKSDAIVFYPDQIHSSSIEGVSDLVDFFWQNKRKVVCEPAAV